MMDTSSAEQRLEPQQDSITVTVGNTVYTVEHIYGGSRSLPEIMGDFLEQKIRNLDV